MTTLHLDKAIAELKQQPNNRSEIITEVWIALQQFYQPNAGELADLLKELCNCCTQVLIVDLIKLTHQYLCANVQRVFTGMQLYVLDTAKSWELAEITQILWMPDHHQYFIYVVFVGWPTKWSEWIAVTSLRLHWLKSKQGELLSSVPTIDDMGMTIQPGERLDFFNNLNGVWERAEIIGRRERRFDIVLANKTRLINCRQTQFAPYRTFT